MIHNYFGVKKDNKRGFKFAYFSFLRVWRQRRVPLRTIFLRLRIVHKELVLNHGNDVLQKVGLLCTNLI